MKNWFEELMTHNRRRPLRYIAPRLVAYFFDGGTPTAHCIRDVSLSGMYLLTTQRWYPGTLIMITLQRTEKDDAGVKQSITVQARVMRSAEDGVGLRFVVPKTEEGRRIQQYIADGLEVHDPNALARFLSSFVMGCSLEPPS
jgi:c-di-GMP-binding flagellar brake protein YcgR